MKRREFITLLGGAAAAWPLAARAQQPTECGASAFLHGIADDPEARPVSTAFRQGLRATGLDRGPQRCELNIVGRRRSRRIAEHAAELVDSRRT